MVELMGFCPKCGKEVRKEVLFQDGHMVVKEPDGVGVIKVYCGTSQVRLCDRCWWGGER